MTENVDPRPPTEPSTARIWLTQNINLVKHTANRYIAPFYSLNSRTEAWGEGALQQLFDDVMQDGCLFVLERESSWDETKIEFGRYCYTMLCFGCRSSIYKRFDKKPEVRIPVDDSFDPEYDVQKDQDDLMKAVKDLEPRKRLVLAGFLSGERGFLSDFAKSEGISPQRASQLRDEALDEIRAAFNL